MMRHMFSSKNLFDRVVTTTALFMVLMMAFEGAHFLFAERGVPVVIEQVETVNSPIRPGEAVRVKITRKKNRACPLTSHRIAKDINGHVYQLGTVISEGGPVGDDAIYVNYATPVTLPEGSYDLQVRLLYDCNDAAYLVEQQTTRFVVWSDPSAK